MKLTQTQIDSYRKNGYLILENIFDDEDLLPVTEAIQAWIDRRVEKLYAEGKIASPYRELDFAHRFAKILVECPEGTQGIDIMRSRLPEVFTFLRNNKLMEALSGLIGSEISCNPIQHLRSKPPTTESTKGIAEVIAWHQDASVTWEEADRSEIITCWIPLVDATKENGCMRIIPGCQDKGDLPHITGATIDPEAMPKTIPLAAEIKRGGAILMSKYTPHCSTPNLSDGIRWSLDLRYQKTGTPTGRPFYPDFVTYSESDPSSVLTDHAEWCRLWTTALEEAKGIKWHRTVPREERIPEHLKEKFAVALS